MVGGAPAMSMLPFQQSDVVRWREQTAFVVEVKGERVVVETPDRIIHITTEAVLREMQVPKRRGAG